MTQSGPGRTVSRLSNESAAALDQSDEIAAWRAPPLGRSEEGETRDMSELT